jgi:hypothetical protein
MRENSSSAASMLPTHLLIIWFPRLKK